MRVVVAYDIESDRIRAKIADYLGRSGWRVQKSVFECLLESSKDLDRLGKGLERLLQSPDNGDIRIYRLCDRCYAASVGLGDIEEGSGGEPWIIV